MMTLMLAVLGLLWYANQKVERCSEGYTYETIDAIPYKKVGLLLGTSKVLSRNRINLFFKYRIDATVALYRNQKLKYIIISGDHSEKYYNEPEDMKRELVAQGVPDSIIFLDYAGLRTLDSVIRCHEIFGQNDFMIISQAFHNERAIFIAQNANLNAIGFNAREPSVKFGVKTYIREYFARVKVLLDTLLNKRPKYLGNKVSVP
ncbi:MAG TPA: ElyC/SanA/YdcF family protein [Cytophagales bacterium]|nr:ElyC/SanA/YdcF family protein [Cytophagales bacterium]